MAAVEEGSEDPVGGVDSVDPGASSLEGTKKTPAALLVVIGELHSAEERNLALQCVVDGLLSFDSEKSSCNLEEELKSLVKQSSKDNTCPGETVIEYRSELLHVDILVNPRFEVVRSALCSFLLTGFSYRFLLYSGLTLQNFGGWFLQDGYFSFSSISDIFHESEVLQALSAQPGSQLDISVVSDVGDWSPVNVSKLSSHLTVRLNPPKIKTGTDSVSALFDFLSSFIQTPSSADLLVSTTVFGNISQSLPTLHVFPAGQGDSALFSLSGLNLLFDGGYGRRSCFWDIVRHLPSLDAVILSHFGPNNLFGFGSFLEKKVLEKGFPEIGATFLNAQKAKTIPATEKTQSLVVKLVDRAALILDSLHHSNTVVLPCLGSIHNQLLLPIPLYHKVGHGSVDLYVLNPLADNREAKDLLTNWTKNLGGHKGGIPTMDHVSICSLLLWKPVSANERSVRILFPGNSPQTKIFEGLDRLKSVGVFQNASGIVEKGATKAATTSGKIAPAGKGKTSIGAKQENKDVVKPTTEQNEITERTKDVKKAKDQQKETKKFGAETKDGMKLQKDIKNGKTPSTAMKKDGTAKGSQSVTKITKTQDEGDNITKKPKQMSSARDEGFKETESNHEEEKKGVDEIVAFSGEAKSIEPIISHPVITEDLSQVQSLPSADLRVEELQTEKGMLEEVEQEDNGLKKASPNASESKGVESQMDDSFNPAKNWGIPEGLPAPVDGKEPAAAKKASHNTSVAADNNHLKKTGGSLKATETSKTTAKRPTTAPDRLNNTARDGLENEEKTLANQSLAKGRSSVVGLGSARGDVKKQSSKPVVPFYVDVAYVPAHGSLSHFDVDFFRRIRARYYVLSCVSPSRKVMALLVEGKQTWDEPSVEVTVIPTYGSELLMKWISENQDQLQKLNIKIATPASKCTIQLQDTVCASYRLEF